MRRARAAIVKPYSALACRCRVGGRLNGYPRAAATSCCRRVKLIALWVGTRRFIILSSWRDFLQRQQEGRQRDPAAKAQSAARYAETAAISKARYAPKSGTSRRKADTNALKH